MKHSAFSLFSFSSFDSKEESFQRLEERHTFCWVRAGSFSVFCQPALCRKSNCGFQIVSIRKGAWILVPAASGLAEGNLFSFPFLVLSLKQNAATLESLIDFWHMIIVLIISEAFLIFDLSITFIAVVFQAKKQCTNSPSQIRFCSRKTELRPTLDVNQSRAKLYILQICRKSFGFSQPFLLL